MFNICSLRFWNATHSRMQQEHEEAALAAADQHTAVVSILPTFTSAVRFNLLLRAADTAESAVLPNSRLRSLQVFTFW